MRHYPLAALVSLLVLIMACSSSDRADSQTRTAQKDTDQHNAVLAQKRLEKALEDNPESSEIRYQLAQSVEAQGLIYDALHQYIHLNTNDPLFSPAFESAARILQRTGDTFEALSRAHSFADLLKEDPYARLLVARLHLRQNDNGRARAIIDTAAEFGLDKSVAQLVRAEAFFRSQQFDSAQAIASRVLQSGGDSPWYYRQAADYLETAGLIDSAVAVSRLSLSDDDPGDVFLLDHFYRLLRVGYHWQAQQIVDSLALANRPPSLISVLYMDAYIAADEDSEAEMALARLSREVSLNLTRLMYELLTDIITGNILTIQESAAMVLKHLSQYPYSDDFKRIMAWQLAIPTARHGDQIEGLDYIQLVRGQQANFPEVRLTHTELLFKSGQFDKGFQGIETLHRFHKQEPVWLTGLADIARNHDTIGTDVAVRYYREALAQDRWYRDAFEKFVGLYREERQFDKALALFSEYSHYAQRYPSCAVLQSFVLVENQRIDQAMELFAENIPRLRGNLDHWRDMRFVLEREGFPGERRTLEQLAATLNPENVAALMFAASIAADAGDAERVKQLASQAAMVDADDPAPKTMQAYGAYLAGDVESALESFQTIKNKYRDDPFVLTYYSLMLARTGQQPTQAADMARVAMFGNESDFTSRMHLCRVYYLTGRYDLCVGEARKAITAYRDHFLPYYWAGRAGAKLHRPDVAENLNKAIDLGLYGERLAEAREILARL